MPTTGQQAALAKLAAGAHRLVLADTTIVTMGAPGTVTGDLVIEDGVVAEVGTGLAPAGDGDAVVVDASNSTIVPGLVDSHVHAWEGQLRGIGTTDDFWSYWAHTHDGPARFYTPQDVAIGQRLTIAQALNSGVTTIVDNSHNSRTAAHTDAALGAIRDSGIRAVYAAGAAQAGDQDGQLPGDLLRLRDTWTSDLIHIRFFDSAPSLETWTWARENGFDLSTEMGAHIADLSALATSGLMGPGHTYNHCLGLGAEIWEAIARSGAAVNLAPRSDSQFGLVPFAPVLEAQRAGITFGVSTDNEVAYGYDMFTELRTLLTISHGLRSQAAAAGEQDLPPRMGPSDALRAATVGGARNANLAGTIGTLERGKQADVVVVSRDALGTMLAPDPTGAITAYAGPHAVDAVFIAGVPKKWGGELVGTDVRALAAEGGASRDRLLSEAGLTLADSMWA